MTDGTVKGPPDHYWEALVTGDRLRSPGLTITEAHLVSWAGLTGDWVSLHLDAEYASGTTFGQRIGHGPLTLSTALGLMTQTGYFTHVVAWLGLDEVRAQAPVYIGDTIRVEATVAEARETSRPGNGLWSLDYAVINQHGDTVMTFTSTFLIERAPHD
ncbi:MaoC/PaaZ C-terminal domain-containing protein [Corynebacterium sp.]|uniref:MaoC/PaaZ C-terminal domain-containing protein n=1 Tax=Corynebacterium sp. TaxID=1720 RepID=UPI0026DEDE27|nr:MaoC/PaaZ C-terminal domain-containing protein [Corynebacterium sp.]MDO5511748.1 MaoC/PaaZ C-terminal domain-containing protein [Corynebacterium sp.]